MVSCHIQHSIYDRQISLAVTHLLFSFPLTSPSPVNLILLHHQELLFLLCMLDYRNPDLPATINSPPSQFTQHGLHDTIQQHSGTFRPQWQQTMELPDVNTITTPGQPSYNRIFFTIKGSSSVFIPQFMDIIHGLTTSSHNISTNTISFKCDSLPKYKTCP